MADREFVQVYSGNFLSHWDRVARSTKPIIAAVNGFAVSGGTLFFCLIVIQAVALTYNIC